MINDELRYISKDIRKKLIYIHSRSNESHIGSSLSIVDILVVLYFKILNVYPKDPDNPNRDRLLLSKGHAATALYAVLAKREFFEDTILDTFAENNSKISVHTERFSVPGIEISSGSLGHALSIGIGISFIAKKEDKKFKTYVIMSDGECEEGSNWEAAISASRFKLDNLIVIVDMNGLQGYEKTDNIQNLSLLKDKWKAFGWSVRQINGHDFAELEKTFNSIPFEKGKPSVIIAETIKGKGIKEMENKLEWHYKSPKLENIEKYIKSLERDE
ncbi:MAG: transketolase [Candidatus Micrarchaeia archaeon]